MEKHGLDYFDVYYENVDETNILTYLDSEKIYAGHTWEPTKTMVEQNGYNVIATAGDVPGIITDVLVFNSDFVIQHHDEIQSIVFALNDARDFVYSNPEEAITIMAKIEGLSFKDMSDAMNDADRPNSDKQKILFNSNSDNSLVDLTKQFLNFYKNTGIITDNPLFVNDDIIIDELFVDDFVNTLRNS
jgi:NitT/TauT family transport system substrate-binding protein